MSVDCGENTGSPPSLTHIKPKPIGPKLDFSPIPQRSQEKYLRTTCEIDQILPGEYTMSIQSKPSKYQIRYPIGYCAWCKQPYYDTKQKNCSACSVGFDSASNVEDMGYLTKVVDAEELTKANKTIILPFLAI